MHQQRFLSSPWRLDAGTRQCKCRTRSITPEETMQRDIRSITGLLAWKRKAPPLRGHFGRQGPASPYLLDRQLLCRQALIGGSITKPAFDHSCFDPTLRE